MYTIHIKKYGEKLMNALIVAINSKYIHPAMGAYQIITNSNYPVDLLEFTIKDDIQHMITEIKKHSIDVLAFSMYIWNIQIMKEILLQLALDKKHYSILVGGPEASYRAKELLEQYSVDFVIKNEGEESWNELLHALEHNKKFHQVSNLYYKKGTEIAFTFDQEPNIQNIKHNYTLIHDFTNRIVYVEAARGCYFRCSYCLASLEQHVRFFDIAMIKQELQFLLDKKTKMIKFLDRSFNVNKEHMLDILHFIKENDNNFTTFQFEVVGDLLDDTIIDFIITIRKGYLRFEIGIQSFNPKTIKAVSRTQDFFKLKANITKLKDHSTIHTDLIAGLPYETKHSFIHTFDEAFALFPHELQLGFLKELQGTVISLTKEVHEYLFDEHAPYEVIQNKYISKAELDEIRDVEEILDIFYNKGYYPKTNHYLFKDCSLPPYFTFLELYQYAKTNNIILKQVQIPDLTKFYYEFLKEKVINREELLYFIKQDYLFRSKIRPKIWWENTISKMERKEIYELFCLNNPTLSIHDLYRYAKLEKYNNRYFVVIYYSDERQFLQIEKQ